MTMSFVYYFHIFPITFIEGDWFCDKANGQGVYLHKNGAKYEGQW